MTSGPRGSDTSVVEVTNISQHGFWILLGAAEELFLPFSEFPWFQDAAVAKICAVELAGPGYFCLRDLDIDLSVGSIRRPEKYPLRAKHKA